MMVGWVISERGVGDRAIRAPVRRVLSPRKSVLPPLVVARYRSSSARDLVHRLRRYQVGDDHTTVLVEHRGNVGGDNPNRLSVLLLA